MKYFPPRFFYNCHIHVFFGITNYRRIFYLSFMKYLSVIVILLLATACNNKEEVKVANEQNKLLQLNRQYDSALLVKDTAALNRLYADDFIYTSPEGKVLNKQQQILNVAVSEFKLDTARSEDVKISFYNNTAVMTGSFKGAGTYRAAPVSIHERYTTVWIRRDSSWVIVAEQGNIIAQQ